MLRSFLAVALLAFFSLYAKATKADAIYQFNGNITGAESAPFTATLDINYSAVTAGTLDFSIHPCCGFVCPLLGACITTGDATDFVSFTDSFYAPGPAKEVTSNFATGLFAINLFFDSSESVSGTLSLHDAFQDIVISGTNGLWSGTFSADNANCDVAAQPPQRCFLSGNFVEVPEPWTAYIFLAGLSGMFAGSLARTSRLRFFPVIRPDSMGEANCLGFNLPGATASSQQSTYASNPRNTRYSNPRRLAGDQFSGPLAIRNAWDRSAPEIAANTAKPTFQLTE